MPPLSLRSDVRRAAPATIALAALLAVAACGGGAEEQVGRGAGLASAELPAAERAQIYAAALGASFEMEPGLTLLVDSVMLPRSLGYEPGPTLPADVVRAMVATPAFRGVCRPARAADAEGARRAPRCDAPQAGYVVRVSDIFRRAGDTLQTYALSERYDTETSGQHPAFRLEQAYQLVRRGDRWAVARTAKITIPE